MIRYTMLLQMVYQVLHVLPYYVSILSIFHPTHEVWEASSKLRQLLVFQGLNKD